LIDAFGNSEEATALFGNSSLEDRVSSIYQQLFSRQADSAGLDFYISQITNGVFTLPSLVMNIADGAQNEDADIINNKLQLAESFTKRIETESIKYETDLAVCIIRSIIAQVDADSDVAGLATELLDDGISLIQSVAEKPEVVSAIIPAEGSLENLHESMPAGTSFGDTLKFASELALQANDKSDIEGMYPGEDSDLTDFLQQLPEETSIDSLIAHAAEGTLTELVGPNTDQDDPGSLPSGPSIESATIWINTLDGSSEEPARIDATSTAATIKVDPDLSGYVNISGFGADDSIVLNQVVAELLSISSQDGVINLVTNNNGTINHLVLTDVVSETALIHDLVSFNALAVGDISFGTEFMPRTESLDAMGGTPARTAFLDAGAAPFCLIDSISTPSNTRIENFGSDDSLRLEGVSSSEVSVSSMENDVLVSVNNEGIVSSIELLGVVSSQDIIFDVDSFNQLPIGDIAF
jgi:hypothetical protein